MISKSLLEMVKGRWREFCREPSALFFVVLMPIVWMIILGLAFGGERKERYGIGLVEKAGPPAIEALAHDPSIDLRRGKQDDLELLRLRGDIQVLVVPDSTHINYLYDPTNPQAVQARRAVDDVLQRASGRIDPLPAANITAMVPGSRYIDFLIPGLLAFSILTSSLFGTGMTIVVNRRENLLKRYLATPMRTTDYILSHLIGRLLVYVVEFCSVVLTGCLFFSFRLAGSWLTFAAFGLLGTMCFSALGIMLGARTRNSAAYNGITNLITLPMMLVAGVWFSRQGFPPWLKTASDFLPLTALADGLRRIALEGASWAQLIPQTTVLVLTGVVAFIVARARFRWF